MDFFDRMKKVVNQGFETTKEALGTAADKAKELGEKGVLKFEISQLERDAGRKFALLGNSVYQTLAIKGQSSVTKNSAEVKPLIAEISELEKRIQEKEKALKEIG